VKTCLLDSSFLIDLLNEIAAGDARSAHRWLRRNASAELWISPVTLAEVLEGARNPEAIKDYLRRYGDHHFANISGLVKAAHTLSIGALNVLSIISFFFFISWPPAIYSKAFSRTAHCFS
jgi:predicted nucleic acid-binding protein